MTIDLAALEPAPDKVVANLPYGVAAGVLLRSDRGAAAACAVGGDGPARGRRAPGGRARAAARTACRRCSPSWRARWRCCARSRAPSSIPCRTSTRCSCGCAGARGAATAARTSATSPALRALVAGAFAHRRKTLAGSLALAGGAGAAAALARAGARGADAARPSRGRARRAPVARGLPGARAPARAMRPSRLATRWRGALAPGVHRRSRPRRSTSGCSSGRCARATAGTSW